MLRNTLLIVLIFLTSGCITRSLLEDSSYTEEIEYFMISENGSNLVVIGEDHHYIFDIDNNLKNILLADNSPQLTPDFNRFRAELDGAISGSFKLTNQTPADAPQEQWLKKHGFTFNEYTQHFDYEAKLSGTRYLADKKINDLYSFEKKYTITVIEDDSTAEKAGKLMLTPLTLAADGALVIAGTGITLALFIPIYYGALLTGNCTSDWC